MCRKAAFYSCSGARRSETSHRHLWQQGKSSQTTPILCFSNALVLYQLKLSNFLLTCRISSTVAAFSRPGPFQLATTAMTLILVSSSILFRHNGVEQIRDTMSVAVNEVKPIFQNAADHPIFRNRHLHLPVRLRELYEHPIDIRYYAGFALEILLYCRQHPQQTDRLIQLEKSHRQ